MKNYNLLSNNFRDPRRPSVGILNTQLKQFQQNFPKQTRIITTKTNFEKDIDELIPKNFERNKNIEKNDNVLINNFKNSINENQDDNKELENIKIPKLKR